VGTGFDVQRSGFGVRRSAVQWHSQDIGDFGQFLSIGKESIGQTRAQRMNGLDFGYLKPEKFSPLDDPRSN
jgi:hypothetical protein